MKQDRVTVGLDSSAQATMSGLMDLGWFEDAQDVARLAVAVAIRQRLPEGEAIDTDTRWAAGNFDSTGEIRSIVLANYPTCQTPVRLMEYLVNEGLRLLAAKLDAADLTPEVLMV